jgi:hypothetical protein
MAALPTTSWMMRGIKMNFYSDEELIPDEAEAMPIMQDDISVSDFLAEDVPTLPGLETSSDFYQPAIERVAFAEQEVGAALPALEQALITKVMEDGVNRQKGTFGYGMTEDQYMDPATYGFEGQPRLQSTAKPYGMSQEEYDNEGGKYRKVISIDGGSNEFQGLGKYATPEEFYAANPEGFAATNPALYQQMLARNSQGARIGREAGGNILQQLGERVKNIEKLQNPNDMMMAAAALSGDIAKQKDDIVKRIVAEVDSKYDLERLKGDIIANQKADMADPGFAAAKGKFSPFTQMAEDTFKKAAAARDKELKERISLNPVLADLESGGKYLEKMAENIVRTRMMDIERDKNAAERRAERQADIIAGEERRKLAKKEEREEKLLEEADRFFASIGGNSKYLSDITPFKDIASDPIAVKARFGMMDQKTKTSVMEALSGGEDRAFGLAITGNPYAEEILIKSMQNASGRDVRDIKKELSDYGNFVRNPIAAGEVFKELISGGMMKKDPTLDALIAKHASPMTKYTSKDEAAEGMKWRMNFVNTYAGLRAQKELKGNVEKWVSDEPMPSALKNYLNDPARDTSKPLSIDAAIDLAIPMKSVQERRQYIDELSTYYAGAIGRRNRSAIGHIDPRQASYVKNKFAASVYNEMGIGSGVFGWN